ncbi:MAG TPA: hypothetical protein VNI34_10745 [Candidatus Nitrosotalea sp.]|nr:hypothetical protein [Candidatus Nitrosotalea sp.]
MLRAALAVLLGLAACACTSAAASPVPPVTPSPLLPVSSLWTPPTQIRSSGPAQPKSTPSASPRTAPGPSVGPTPEHGYDVSYPQCASVLRPAGAGFALIGVNGGKAFTANPCLGREWRAAQGTATAYLNSGYNPANYAKAPTGCQRFGARIAASAAQQEAYAIGCGEAVYSLQVIHQAGIVPKIIFWIDVESSNSWSTQDLSLNRYALQGEFDQLTGRGYLVGVYSTFQNWAEITQDWTAPTVSADWLASTAGAPPCPGVGFSRAPVWLRQDPSPWPSPAVDSDWTC